MSGMTRSSAGLDARRRRALFRAWHRGLREMDLLLGRFVESRIDQFTEQELDNLERLMEVPDQQVLAWITGQDSPPEEHASGLFSDLVIYHETLHGDR